MIRARADIGQWPLSWTSVGLLHRYSRKPLLDRICLSSVPVPHMHRTRRPRGVLRLGQLVEEPAEALGDVGGGALASPASARLGVGGEAEPLGEDGAKESHAAVADHAGGALVRGLAGLRGLDPAEHPDVLDGEAVGGDDRSGARVRRGAVPGAAGAHTELLLPERLQGAADEELRLGDAPR